MKEKISDLIVMIMFNALVIGTVLYKRNGGTAMNFKSTNGVVLIILLVLMAVIDVFYIVRLIANKKQSEK